MPLFVLSLYACSSGASSAPKESAEKKDQAAQKSGAPVRVAAVVEERVPLTIEISGQLASPEDSAIAAEVEGKVVRISADLGDRVKQGQLLAQINPDEYRYKMEQADAQSQQAEANLSRIQKLAKNEMVSQQQLDDARFSAAQAKANADLAKKKFQDTEVRAPFNGAIAKRSVSSGEYVRVGQALFEVVVLDSLKLTGEIPERYLSQIKPGDEVTADVDAYKDQPFKGQISRISPAVNATSRSFTVEARIDNKAGNLKPGLFAHARLGVGVEDHAPIVPEAAITVFAGTAKVFRIQAKAAHEVRVEVVQHLPDGRVVIAGHELKAGDQVAVEGLARLGEGVEVDVR
jgi:RND family efflux transporter MFP subunit